MHAYDAIAKYRGGLFRSWLLRITANASYDILRRAQRKPTTTLPDAEEGEAELPDRYAADPEAEAGRSELYRYLDAALRLLPEDQRMAVVLCDVYGMDYGEVADATESALGTVKSRIHRGRLRLRELMAEHRELFLNESASGPMTMHNLASSRRRAARRLCRRRSPTRSPTRRSFLTSPTCDRCRPLVDELSLLLGALAELPDLAPSRPLRLIPPVPDAPPPARRSWLRRLTAPAMAAGAALFLIGAIGIGATGAIAGLVSKSASFGTDQAGGPAMRASARVAGADSPSLVARRHARQTRGSTELRLPATMGSASRALQPGATADRADGDRH